MKIEWPGMSLSQTMILNRMVSISKKKNIGESPRLPGLVNKNNEKIENLFSINIIKAPSIYIKDLILLKN